MKYRDFIYIAVIAVIIVLWASCDRTEIKYVTRTVYSKPKTQIQYIRDTGKKEKITRWKTKLVNQKDTVYLDSVHYLYRACDSVNIIRDSVKGLLATYTVYMNKIEKAEYVIKDSIQPKKKIKLGAGVGLCLTPFTPFVAPCLYAGVGVDLK